jgi:hypothetical protein
MGCDARVVVGAIINHLINDDKQQTKTETSQKQQQQQQRRQSVRGVMDRLASQLFRLPSLLPVVLTENGKTTAGAARREQLIVVEDAWPGG